VSCENKKNVFRTRDANSSNKHNEINELLDINPRATIMFPHFVFHLFIPKGDKKEEEKVRPS